MKSLHMALPRRLRGPHAEDSTALAPLIEAAIAPRDVVLVKGSLGSRMAVIVETLKNPESLLPRAANGD
jgi:UDP-N-acetylmuramoyl-tripeptide--D-alanyl-D-alanine ligase